MLNFLLAPARWIMGLHSPEVAAAMPLLMLCLMETK